jgi:peptide/nickel transport system permease protein
MGGRLVAALATLLIASMLIFAATFALPGNVADVALGQDATPQRVSQLETELHLNQPLPALYIRWLRGMATGHLGQSTAALAQGRSESVWHMIATPMRNSLVLAAIAITLFVIASVALGVITALHAGRITDHVVSAIALASGAMPEFLIGTLLTVVFFNLLGWLPPIAPVPPGDSPLTNPSALILPVVTLLGVSLSFGVRLVRAATIEVLGERYVALARMNGLPWRRILLGYVLRNSLGPGVQALAQTTRYMIGGLIVVESVFDYPGIGTVLVTAVNDRDVQVISVVATMIAAVYIAINLAADLAVGALVPSLRASS